MNTVLTIINSYVFIIQKFKLNSHFFLNNTASPSLAALGNITALGEHIGLVFDVYKFQGPVS